MTCQALLRLNAVCFDRMYETLLFVGQTDEKTLGVWLVKRFSLSHVNKNAHAVLRVRNSFMDSPFYCTKSIYARKTS